jgi:hypothetical protein
MSSPSELEFMVEFKEPIELESTMNSETVHSITMGFPTVEHHIEAMNAVGETNLLRLQYAIFARAIVKVNGSSVDASWKRSKGIMLFNKSTNVKEDIGKISDTINSYGITPIVDKVCKECGKVWQPVINTLNFFDSALQ